MSPNVCQLSLRSIQAKTVGTSRAHLALDKNAIPAETLDQFMV